MRPVSGSPATPASAVPQALNVEFLDKGLFGTYSSRGCIATKRSFSSYTTVLSECLGSELNDLDRRRGKVAHNDGATARALVHIDP